MLTHQPCELLVVHRSALLPQGRLHVPPSIGLEFVLDGMHRFDQGGIVALLLGSIVVSGACNAHQSTSFIASRGAVSDEALAVFKLAGFDDQAALEVVLGVSLATLCNFANNLGQPPLNAQLEPYRWEKLAIPAAAE
jgi:hypothetical protein